MNDETRNALRVALCTLMDAVEQFVEAGDNTAGRVQQSIAAGLFWLDFNPDAGDTIKDAWK